MLSFRDTELRSSADSLTHVTFRTPDACSQAGLAPPGSLVRSPIRARLAAIDAELAGRTAVSGPGYPAPRVLSLRRAAARVEEDAPVPGAGEDERSLIGCRELGKPRQGNIFVQPRLRTDDAGEGSKAVALRGRLTLTVQLAQALFLRSPSSWEGMTAAAR
jgi:hypothetical protein